jgi:elongation factor G
MSMTQGTRQPSGHAPAEQIRNVVLVGPGGAGKTMLVEALLAATGAITRAGSIENGSTVCDVEDVEKRVGRSVSLAVASTVATDPAITGGPPVRINLLDTPGHADFVGELRAGLRAADAALFVLSAAERTANGSPIDGATRMLWQECAAVGMPRAVVITHVDQPRGDFAAAVESCQLAFGDGVHPLYLPLATTGGAPQELIGLLSQTVFDHRSGARVARPADDRQRAEIAGVRDELVEAVITESEDDGLLDRYLGGEQVDFDAVVDDLETAVARGAFHPVLACVPTTGLGVTEVLEVICRCLPLPAEHVLPPVYTPVGAERDPLSGSANGPLVAEVVKTSTDPYVGRISVVRVFSGTLSADVPVHVSGHFARFSGHPQDETWHGEHDLDERAGAISRPLGAALTPIPLAVAGDIVTVARLSHAETGDTLSDPADPAVLAPWKIPEPQLPVAISARSSSDEDKLVQGLARLQAEDPTVRVEVNPATEQLLLWTMGEQHLDVLLDRLRTRGGIEVAIEPVRVAVRETVRSGAAGLGRHVKQSGGHGQYAVAQIEVEPLPQGTGFEFVDRVVGGAVPRQYIPSVEKGIRAQLEHGVDGHPMVDLRVTLTGGKAHSVDSSDAAFQLAGALALKEASHAAGVQLLEQMDSVTITVDDEFVGAVLADLSSRRGRVRGTEPTAPGRSIVSAEVPEVELARYAVDLRALAHGTGSFTRSYLRYSPAPDQVLDRLLATVR